jgi:hypothetical protein
MLFIQHHVSYTSAPLFLSLPTSSLACDMFGHPIDAADHHLASHDVTRDRCIASRARVRGLYMHVPPLHTSHRLGARPARHIRRDAPRPEKRKREYLHEKKEVGNGKGKEEGSIRNVFCLTQGLFVFSITTIYFVSVYPLKTP